MPRNVDSSHVFLTHEEALNCYNSEDLKDLIKLITKNRPVRKADCVAEITRYLSGGGLQRYWESLGDTEKAAVAEIVHGLDESFDASMFRCKYGVLPDCHEFRSYDARRKNLYTLLNIVLILGRMPLDLRKRFGEFVPPPRENSIATVEELPKEVPSHLPKWRKTSGYQEPQLAVVETERAARHDLTAVLRAIDAGKVKVSDKTKRVTASSASFLLSFLCEGDYPSTCTGDRSKDAIRPFAWPLIAQAAGWAKATGTTLQLSKKGKDALTRPPHEALKEAWKSWLGTKVLDELNRIDSIKGQNAKRGGGLAPVAPRRAAVNDALTRCPARAWIDIDEFFRFCVATGNDFDVARTSWGLYVADREYGNLSNGGWQLVQGRFIMCLLFEYAATLGLIDIATVPAEWGRQDFRDIWGTDDLDAFSRYDGLKFFRINALGAYCLGIEDTYECHAHTKKAILKVLPNHDIVVTEHDLFNPGDGFFLDRVCVKGHDSTWKLDLGKILSAMESGLQPEEVHFFLEAKNKGPLPENVTLFIRDCAKRSARVRHAGSAEIFEAADHATALLITHDSAAKGLCRLAGEKTLVVPTDSVAAFRRALKNLGLVAPPKSK